MCWASKEITPKETPKAVKTEESNASEEIQDFVAEYRREPGTCVPLPDATNEGIDFKKEPESQKKVMKIVLMSAKINSVPWHKRKMMQSKEKEQKNQG